MSHISLLNGFVESSSAIAAEQTSISRVHSSIERRCTLIKSPDLGNNHSHSRARTDVSGVWKAARCYSMRGVRDLENGETNLIWSYRGSWSHITSSNLTVPTKFKAVLSLNRVPYERRTGYQLPLYSFQISPPSALSSQNYAFRLWSLLGTSARNFLAAYPAFILCPKICLWDWQYSEEVRPTKCTERFSFCEGNPVHTAELKFWLHQQSCHRILEGLPSQVLNKFDSQ